MGFADSIRATVEKQQEQVNNKIIEIATDLFTNTVYHTPVLKAVLKDNWYPAEGKDQVDLTYQPFSANGGLSSMTRILALSKSKTFVGRDSEVSLTNTTPYGFRAEYRGWPTSDNIRWKGAKPYAMMRKALIETSTKYREEGK